MWLAMYILKHPTIKLLCRTASSCTVDTDCDPDKTIHQDMQGETHVYILSLESYHHWQTQLRKSRYPK